MKRSLFAGVALLAAIMVLPNGILGGLSHFYARWNRK